MTKWLRGPLLDTGDDLWASVDAALAEWSPEVPAVVDPASGAVSASDLRARVESAAGTLAAAGARAGDTVVLDLERSVDEIVHVLACVRQGLAYVGTSTDAPVSSHLPTVAAANPVVIVSRRGADWSDDPRVITPAEGHRGFVVPPPSVAEVCYVSFTSGTTGHPKGVETPRAGVDRLMRGADYCVLGSGDRVLRFAPLAFDASTFEIYCGLWRRATIVIGPRGPLDLDTLADFLVDEAIDVCWLTSGLFSSLVDYRPQAFAKLRQVLTGGDRVSGASVTDLLNRYPDLSVVNGYGPTEATTFATVRTITIADLPLTSVPIGRPIGDTDVGVASDGEILIAGRGLAVGYRNDPELTAERFPTIDGRRVYRTGDLGAIVGGELHFAGRLDRQLKVRGFRVEPGSVDETLRRAHLVAESWTFGDRGSAGTEIVCAVVPTPGPRPSSEALRRGLSDGGLPDYALPHRFVDVAALPLTTNGKVDEAALVAIAQARDESARARDAAPASDATVLVEEVRRTWASALGSSDFDDDTGFFDSGGDSLRLAKVHAMLADSYPAARLKLVDLLVHASVAEQAGALHARLQGQGSTA